jgi:hypothetical protein
MKPWTIIGSAAFCAAVLASAACSKDSGSAAASTQSSVKECDDWIAKMQACAPKLDPAKRAEFESGLDATKEGFAAQASNAQSKAGLQANCKLLLDNFDKTYPQCK